MRPAGVGNLYFIAGDVHISLTPDKMAINLLSIALLEAPKFLGQHTVKGVGDHSHEDVEVHLHQYRRRQDVKVEELNRLGDHILHPPPASIVTNNTFRRSRQIVGHQKGGFFMTVPSDNDLPELPFIVLQSKERLMDLGIGIFPFIMGNVDLLPGTEFFQVPDQFLAPPTKGDELNAFSIQKGEMLVRGKFGIEDEGGFNTFANLIPKGQDIDHLLIGLVLHDVGSRIKNKLGSGILGEEGQGTLHPFSPGTGPMLLQDRFISIMGNGVKVQIDDAPIVEPQFRGLFDKGLLELQDMNFIQGIGIGGHRRALGQDIEPGEQPQAGIEGVVSHVGVSLRADELQGQKGQKIVDRRNGLGPRQASGTDQFRHLQLFQKRDKQKGPSR